MAHSFPGPPPIGLYCPLPRLVSGPHCCTGLSEPCFPEPLAATKPSSGPADPQTIWATPLFSTAPGRCEPQRSSRSADLPRFSKRNHPARGREGRSDRCAGWLRVRLGKACLSEGAGSPIPTLEHRPPRNPCPIIQPPPSRVHRPRRLSSSRAQHSWQASVLQLSVCAADVRRGLPNGSDQFASDKPLVVEALLPHAPPGPLGPPTTPPAGHELNPARIRPRVRPEAGRVLNWARIRPGTFKTGHISVRPRVHPHRPETV